jgi:hypothetical protein
LEDEKAFISFVNHCREGGAGIPDFYLRARLCRIIRLPIPCLIKKSPTPTKTDQELTPIHLPPPQKIKINTPPYANTASTSGQADFNSNTNPFLFGEYLVTTPP